MFGGGSVDGNTSPAERPQMESLGQARTRNVRAAGVQCTMVVVLLQLLETWPLPAAVQKKPCGRRVLDPGTRFRESEWNLDKHKRIDPGGKGFL